MRKPRGAHGASIRVLVDSRAAKWAPRKGAPKGEKRPEEEEDDDDDDEEDEEDKEEKEGG